jgi:hypothetical protein
MKKIFLVSLIGGAVGGFVGAAYAYFRCQIEGAIVR